MARVVVSTCEGAVKSKGWRQPLTSFDAGLFIFFASEKVTMVQSALLTSGRHRACARPKPSHAVVPRWHSKRLE